MAAARGRPGAVHLHHARGVRRGARAGDGATTTSGAAPACTPTTRTCASPASTTWSSWRGCRRSSPSARPGSTTTASNGRSVADMDWQRERFRVHIRAARRPRLPLVIHTRSASDDTLAMLREEGADARAGGVFHCFTETAAVARAALDLGFYISFSGILTFKNAAGPARGGALRAAGPLPDRDRQPVSRAGAVSRQDQHPGLRALGRAPARRAQGAAGRGGRGATSANFERLFERTTRST